jgi:SulP family sulfate permease
VASALDRIADRHKAFILDLAAVPFLDSTAANTIAGLADKAARHRVQLLITGASPRIRHTLLTHGLRAPQVRYVRSVEDAVRAVRVSVADAER